MLTPKSQTQINGTRAGAAPTAGGANIEMGGSNANQLIEHVRSYDPRSWSCLHVAEGALSCNNVTVQHNDIGPCGSDLFQQWADGISVSCQNSLVHNNTVNNPTVSSRVPSPQALIDTHLFIGSVRMAVSFCSVHPGHWWRTTRSGWRLCV